MSQFLVYNTDDPNRSDTVLTGNQVLTIPATDPSPTPGNANQGAPTPSPGAIYTGVASKVAGSIFADAAGSCAVQQSFDALLPGNVPNANAHWDIVDTIAVTATTPTKIDLDVLGPALRVVYTNGSGAQTSHFRIFIRIFGIKGGG